MRPLGFVVASSLVVLSAALNAGCGTVMGHADLQDVTIQLSPDEKDAEVKINGVKAGNGSGKYKVDPKRESNRVEVTTQDGRQGHGAFTREVMTGVVIADAVMLLFPIYIDYFDG